MSSTSADSVAPLGRPAQAASATATAAAQPPSRKLSLEDISKYFNLPIADAASILGVCTSVLKRICRENGIIRWPYRKFLAGKTVEDIKKEAAREKSRELARLSSLAKQKLDAQKTMPSTSAGFSTFGNQVQNRAPAHQGVSMQGNALQLQGNRSFQHGWSSTVQNQTKHIPTYFDDFKHGFPVNGLSRTSHKWWGTGTLESSEKVNSSKPPTNEEGKQDSFKSREEPSSCMIDEQTCSVNDSALTTKPSASLVSLRKRTLEHAHESLVGLSSCESYQMSKRKKLLLFQVFRSSFPDQWKDGYS